MSMIEVECENCGETVKKYPRALERSDQLFCSNECHNEFQTEYKRRDCGRCGAEIDRRPSTYAGQESVFCSVECKSMYHREQWPTVECANCETEFRIQSGLYQQRIELQGNDQFFCSNECQGEWETGENNPNYDENAGHPIYGSTWRQQRREARKRDGYACVVCGMTDAEHIDTYGWELEVHHIEPVRAFDDADDANDLDNLITLCRPHHREYESLPNERAKELLEGE